MIHLAELFVQCFDDVNCSQRKWCGFDSII